MQRTVSQSRRDGIAGPFRVSPTLLGLLVQQTSMTLSLPPLSSICQPRLCLCSSRITSFTTHVFAQIKNLKLRRVRRIINANKNKRLLRTGTSSWRTEITGSILVVERKMAPDCTSSRVGECRRFISHFTRCASNFSARLRARF